MIVSLLSSSDITRETREAEHVKIIGAGLPRTATLTQKIALEMLGFGPCYHMMEVMGSTDRMSGWIDAFHGKPNWDAVYEGFTATVDWPGSYFYRELAEAYPDTKVLLSVRNGIAWARSMRNTIWEMVFGDSPMHHLMMAHARIDPVRQQFTEMLMAMSAESEMLDPDLRDFDEKALAASMERHNTEVRRLIPKDRLLEWWPTDGWEPLCEFLRVPVPAVPVPHVNDTAAFGEMMTGGYLEALNEWHAQQYAPTN